MIQSLSNRVVRLTELSYTGRHVVERVTQIWRVLSSRDVRRLVRLIAFILLDIFMGLCLAHVLRRFFVTPQRSIGRKRYNCTFKNFVLEITIGR